MKTGFWILTPCPYFPCFIPVPSFNRHSIIVSSQYNGRRTSNIIRMSFKHSDFFMFVCRYFGSNLTSSQSASLTLPPVLSHLVGRLLWINGYVYFDDNKETTQSCPQFQSRCHCQCYSISQLWLVFSEYVFGDPITTFRTRKVLEWVKRFWTLKEWHPIFRDASGRLTVKVGSGLYAPNTEKARREALSLGRCGILSLTSLCIVPSTPLASNFKLIRLPPPPWPSFLSLFSNTSLIVVLSVSL